MYKQNIYLELDEILTSRGYKMRYLTADPDKEVNTASAVTADILQFIFKKSDKDYGPVSILVDDDRSMKIYFTDKVSKSPPGTRGASITNVDWISLLKIIKRVAHKYGIESFHVRDRQRLRHDIRQRSEMKQSINSEMMESLSKHATVLEGYYGNKNTSYTDDVSKAKLIIKHSRPLGENEQRFRHVDKIFVENETGARFLTPTKKPGKAKMFARHIAEGGDYRDSRWQHLSELCDDISNLGGFIRASRNAKSFSEAATPVIQKSLQLYRELQESSKKICGGNGYRKYFGDVDLNTTKKAKKNNSDELRQILLNSTQDPRVEKAIPVLEKYGIAPEKINEISELEDWVNESAGIDIVGMLDLSEEQIEDVLSAIRKNPELGVNASLGRSSLKGSINDTDFKNLLLDVAAKNPKTELRDVLIPWMEKQKSATYNYILRKYKKELEDQKKKKAEVEKRKKARQKEEIAKREKEEERKSKKVDKKEISPTNNVKSDDSEKKKTQKPVKRNDGDDNKPPVQAKPAPSIKDEIESDDQTNSNADLDRVRQLAGTNKQQKPNNQEQNV
jgi:hypothetical protein